MSLEVRKQALDQALLFISSFLLLVYGIALTVSPNAETVIITLPVIGVIILAMYAGYMRGSVERDSLSDRARGWVYLVVGVGTYSIMLLFSSLSKFEQTNGLEGDGILFFSAMFVALYFFARGLVNWIFRYLSTEGKMTVRERIPVAGAGFPVFIFSASLLIPSYYVTILTVIPFNSSSAISVVDVVLMELAWAFPLALFEINSHNYISEALEWRSIFQKSVKGDPSKNPTGVTHRVLWPLLRSGAYTFAVLFAGFRKHKSQYMIMGAAIPVYIVGSLATISVANIALALQLFAYFLGGLGLAWHVLTDPNKLCTNAIVERVGEHCRKKVPPGPIEPSSPG